MSEKSDKNKLNKFLLITIMESANELNGRILSYMKQWGGDLAHFTEGIYRNTLILQELLKDIATHQEQWNSFSEIIKNNIKEELEERRRKITYLIEKEKERSEIEK